MGKDDSSRLFSKVVKFVRHPLKDWSDLDTEERGAVDSGYSREMLKEMIERRRRNDFVRRREFDMLRKLRRREVTSPTQVVSSFDSSDDKSEERALTLKKIDEIEEQMSRQWWRGRGQRAEAADPDAAYADTEPDEAEQSVVDIRGLVHANELEEASIRFATGDDAGAEALLQRLLVPNNPQADHNEIWRTLLDLFRATGDAEKFGMTSTRYAQRFKRTGPEWVSLRVLAREAQSALTSADRPSTAGPRIDWHSPARLTRADLAELTRSLGAAGPVWTLDWRALQEIEPSTVAPLHTLLAHWAESPVQLQVVGADRLLTVIEQATPMGVRGTDPAWWMLRMAALRVLHRGDAYELAALNYCLTYEAAPPPWTEPGGRCVHLDAAPAADGTPGESVRPALVGQLSGDIRETLRRLDVEMAQGQHSAVSCGALVRVDPAAARLLLGWVREQEKRGRRIEFVELHRLLAVFFHVVGISDHAALRVRVR